MKHFLMTVPYMAVFYVYEIPWKRLSVRLTFLEDLYEGTKHFAAHLTKVPTLLCKSHQIFLRIPWD